MAESISRLMDGEVDDTEIEIVCAELRRPEAIATWACYHVIGDTLRRGPVPIPGFAQRFAARLAAEPTVLAPQTERPRPMPVAWAAAATVAAVSVVGWVRPPAVPLDYLLAHREYSPTAPIEGIGPGLRTASAISPGIRP